MPSEQVCPGTDPLEEARQGGGQETQGPPQMWTAELWVFRPGGRGREASCYVGRPGHVAMTATRGPAGDLRGLRALSDCSNFVSASHCRAAPRRPIHSELLNVTLLSAHVSPVHMVKRGPRPVQPCRWHHP